MEKTNTDPAVSDLSTRRAFIALVSTGGAAALAGCAGGESSGSDGGGSGDSDGGGGGNEDETATATATETESQESLTHEVGESFVVGEGAQSIEYTVNETSIIEDYIGTSAQYGASPDGTFVVVNLDLENVGDESLDITTNFLKLADQEDRTFDADTEAGVQAGSDSRITADPITFDQLQPGLSVTRAVIFDVPSGEYRFVAEPAGVFSNADTHSVPIGDV